MVLASARLRGIHPPDNIQNGGRPGGECLSNAHWLGPWRQHLMMNHGVAAVTRVDLLYLILWKGGRLRRRHVDNTQDMLFIFVKIISLIKRVGYPGYLGYFVTILGFGYFTKPHHPNPYPPHGGNRK